MFLKFLQYTHKKITDLNFKKPDLDDLEKGLNAMDCALHLEKSVNLLLIELHKLATYQNDSNLCDFIETPLNKQVKSMKNWVTT